MFTNIAIRVGIVRIFVPCSQIRCSLFPFLYQFSMGWRQNYPNIQQRRHWSPSDIFL
ncbi:MAG: hypothetical protein F6K26_32085 [Moorea sp. SIO2I5]|nr:hypothetical protein [Moorena sp. SIO2I5]